jgi:lipid-A-disaccharide synthase
LILKRLYIISGEASGDLHGSNLIKAIRKKNPDIEIRCWGGDLMAEAGAKVVKHYRDLAFMGFVEVLLNLGTIVRNLRFCKEDIKAFNPDAIIFIDYPGFNLRIAKWAREERYRTLYYISPQIWAWKQSRVNAIKRDVDRMFVILPFEKDFYNKFNYEVEFVGHPLIDAIDQFKAKALPKEEFKKKNDLDERPIIAVLPGSRKQEISRMLSVMLKMIPKFPDYQFVIAAAPGMSNEMYHQYSSNVSTVRNDTYNLLNHAHAAMVTSGTATLETGLFGVPEIVCYKGGYFSYLIARQLIKVKFISLVNLIMDREIVRELIQKEMNESNLQLELNKILKDGDYRKTMIENLDLLRRKLGGRGASEKAAELMLKK